MEEENLERLLCYVPKEWPNNLETQTWTEPTLSSFSSLIEKLIKNHKNVEYFNSLYQEALKNLEDKGKKVGFFRPNIYYSAKTASGSAVKLSSTKKGKIRGLYISYTNPGEETTVLLEAKEDKQKIEPSAVRITMSLYSQSGSMVGKTISHDHTIKDETTKAQPQTLRP